MKLVCGRLSCHKYEMFVYLYTHTDINTKHEICLQRVKAHTKMNPS